MDLLSTACTAERREKSHYNDAGRQQTMLRWCVWGRSMGLHKADKKFYLFTVCMLSISHKCNFIYTRTVVHEDAAFKT